MSADKVINLLVTVTLFEMMIAIGLGVTFADVVSVAKNQRVLIRAALANYAIVPAIAVALLFVFQASPMVAAGILTAAVCPGAPYGPPFTAMAKGNVIIAVGLMVILAGSSALLAPLLLYFLLPMVSGSGDLKVDAFKIVLTLLMSQLVPLGVGLLIRNRNPLLAAKLQKPANRLGTILNLVVFGMILVVQFHTLAAIRLRGFAGMFLLVLAATAAGWIFGGAGSENRKAMGLTTGIRNVGVSLVIVTGSFPGTPAVTSALAFAIFQTILLALVALAWGKVSPRANATAAVAVAGHPAAGR